jgi:outer membrane protein assembly factor BamB
VAANGLAYFAAPWRRLVALNSEGPQVWEADTDGNITASPAVGGDGTVYFRDFRYLYAVNTTNGLPPLAKSSWPMWRANPQHTGRAQAAK